MEQRLVELRKRQMDSKRDFQEQAAVRAEAERMAREAADNLEKEEAAAAGLEMAAWLLAQEVEEAEQAVEEERRAKSEAAAARAAEAERIRREAEEAAEAEAVRRHMEAIEAAERAKLEAREEAMRAAKEKAKAGKMKRQVTLASAASDVFESVPTDAGDYFVRSFYADSDDPEDVSKVCFSAFEDSHKALGCPSDFPDLRTAKRAVEALVKHHGVVCFVALTPETNEVCGTCLVDLRDEYASLWPVAVSTKHSNRGVGKALMRAALGTVKSDNKEVVCLQHLSCDTKSFSIGTSLGFRCHDVTLSLKGFVEVEGPASTAGKYEVRMMEGCTDGRDVPACEALYKRAFPDSGVRLDGIGRVDSPMAKWVVYSLETNELVGFSTGFHMQGFTLARDEGVFKEMLIQCTKQIKCIFGPPLEFNLPTSGGIYGGLLKWCLTSANMKAVKQHNAMVKEWKSGSFSGIPASARPASSGGVSSNVSWKFVYCPSSMF